MRIRAVAERRIKDIDRKVTELQMMRGALAHLVHCCREGTTLMSDY
jgi:hypothetical protein